ncbi:MAG: aspartate aminotransferase family protein [Pseudomonadota bacterium]
MSIDALKVRRDALLGKGAPLFYDEPLHIVAGEGVWLTAADGRRYLDMYNNVPCVGHAHPHVVGAMQRQAAMLNVHSRYLHEGVLDYAERLTRLHAEGIDCLVVTCSGTEASEVALLTARAATGRAGVICSDAAYHGNSHEIRKLSRLRLRGDSGDPNIRAVPFPETYRPIAQALSESELCNRYIEELERVIAELEADGIGLAAFMVCSILANEGLPDIPENYMCRAAEIVRAAGGLVISDEVQAGFCRTGTWWGYEAVGFKPDIATMGKPMGNGLPLAGVAARADLVDTFRASTGYFNTFGSSPLQAAVGNAVIDVIEQEGLAERVAAVGTYLREGLRILQAEHERIGDVRGHGLFIGVDWVTNPNTREPDSDGAAHIVNRLREKGFLISNAGLHRNVLKIRPPLVFEREHADLFLSALSDTLREATVEH